MMIFLLVSFLKVPILFSLFGPAKILFEVCPNVPTLSHINYIR